MYGFGGEHKAKRMSIDHEEELKSGIEMWQMSDLPSERSQ